MKTYQVIIVIFILTSCSTRSDKKILQIKKDDKGRIIMEVSEGFDFGEGSFHRTIHYDTLGREIKIFEVKDHDKTVETFEYSDSSTYEYIYYDLGHTNSYTDSNFVVTQKDIAFIRHVRMNSKGIETYMYTKWFGDSIYCQEVIYDSKGRESIRYVNCRD